MKIVKPLTLGLLHQPYRYRGAHRLAIAALGFFALGRDDERYLIENLQWPKALSQLPAGLPLDHVLPKARAEVALAGCAHAARPAQAVDVRLRCGPVDKRLRVYGDRAWRRTLWGGICIEPATPFEKMPLVPERTWGGPGHDNPLGLGFLPRFAALRVRKGAMPNIDYPLEHGCACAQPGRRRHTAAGFLPQQLQHAARRRRASGTYDKRWLAEDFPGLPRDFDFGLYNLTAEDQQFRGHFAGGDAYRLEGLSADGEAIGGTVPAVAVRAWVLDEGQGAEAAREVALHCDTVWFFPEVGLGLAIHRGETEVNDAMAQDVAAVMLGYDAQARPRDAAHYRAVLAQRLDPAQAALHAFDESQLAPVRSAQAEAARAAAREREARATQAKRQRALDAALEEFRTRSGLEVDPAAVAAAATPPALPAIPAQALEECDFDLAELQAQARIVAAQAKADADRRMAELQAQLPPVPPQPAPDVQALRAAALARVRTPAPDLQHGAQPASLPPELADALAMAERAQPGVVDPVQLAEAQTALAQAPALRRAARNAAPQPAPPPPPDDAELARLLGQEALRLRAAGESLAGRDLSDVDLRDADLRGADLREVQLERADLRGADLRDADLRGAVLTAANLDGADLSGADLSGANLCGGSARTARMQGVRLDRVRAFDADWSGADLSGARADGALLLRIALADACLDGSVFARCVLMQARAPRSRWVGAQWSMCVAPSADFGAARFDGARLQRSVLMDADLRGSVWQGATLHTVYCGGKADWQGAQLGLLHATKCGWRAARLVGADLCGATFASCDLGGADLEGARMRDAQLYRSLFLRSRLCGVDAAGASFFQAMCRQADFTGADLRGAVLVQADLAEAVLRDVRMAGARIDQIAGAA